jgi:hypothetical protein
MNNTGNFNNGPPTALMSYPFPMHNLPQRPSLMEQPYMNQMPQQFQPYPTQAYNPRPIVYLYDFIFTIHFAFEKYLDTNTKI